MSDPPVEWRRGKLIRGDRPKPDRSGRPVLAGFGRVVTDLSTYACWTDVVIADGYWGRGLGRMPESVSSSAPEP